MGLIVDLRRLSVLRMAGLYLLGAWLIMQVSSTVLRIDVVRRELRRVSPLRAAKGSDASTAGAPSPEAS